MPAHRTVREIEEIVGTQIRDLRKRAGLTQQQLANDAGVSVGTIRNLESGEGSNLRTLISVLRVVDRTEWLDELAPSPTVSPMALLAAASAKPKR